MKKQGRISKNWRTITNIITWAMGFPEMKEIQVIFKVNMSENFSKLMTDKTTDPGSSKYIK